MATYFYYRAFLESLPRVFLTWLQEDPDLYGWLGELRSIHLEPYTTNGFVARLQIELFNQRTAAPVELTFLLHSNGRVQPQARRDLTNLSDIWHFKSTIEEWVRSISFQEKEYTHTRLQQIKEELMSVVWAPPRVAKLIEVCGFEALD
jgi:hypothetical protein